MSNLQHPAKHFVFILLSFIILSSCKRDDKTEVAPDKISNAKTGKHDVQTIFLNNAGYLEFANADIFEKTAEDLMHKTPGELAEWEKFYSNFKSLRKTYEIGLTEEQKYLQEHTKTGAFAPEGAHSAYVTANRGAFIEDEDGALLMNTYRPELGAILNKDGIVKVGGVILQYSYNHLKIITDGDDKKISLLEDALITDKAKSIAVSKVSRSKMSNKAARTTFSGSCENKTVRSQESCTWYNRVQGDLYLTIVQEPIYTYYDCQDYWEWSESAGDYIWVTRCQSAITGYNKVNQFTAYMRSEKQYGWCWNIKWAADNQVLTVSGQYKENGTAKQVFLTTGTNYPTSSYSWRLFRYVNAATDPDITDAAISFDVENDPRVCRVVFQ